MKCGAPSYDIAGFTARVQESRQMSRMSISELAEETGLSKETVSRLSSTILRGRNCTPSVATVLALAGAMGVSPGWLAFGEGAP